jgi:hypothetical protein
MTTKIVLVMLLSLLTSNHNKNSNFQHNAILLKDIQHNETQHNANQHNDIQHNDIQHNDIQHNDIQPNDIQPNDIQPYDIQYIFDNQHID